MRTSRRQKVADSLADIPKPRLADKVRNSIVGLGFGGVGVFAIAKGDFLIKAAGIAMVFIGGFGVSQDLVKKGTAFALATLKDVLDTVRGKGG